MIKAIETRYNGYHFRSRSEARWAVYFDKVGINYLYENEGYVLSNGQQYLPDFQIKDTKIFVEIKPSNYEWEDDLKHDLFAKEMDCVLIVHAGNPGEERTKVGYGQSFFNNIHQSVEIEGVSKFILYPTYKELDWVKKIVNERRSECGRFCDWINRSIDASRQARFEFNQTPQ